MIEIGNKFQKFQEFIISLLRKEFLTFIKFLIKIKVITVVIKFLKIL
jgi:hypothetical protein